MSNVSYSAKELIKSKLKETTYIVKEIIDKRTIKKQKQYKVWWNNFLKKDATWETEDKLIEDGLQEYINAFEKKKK